jgi:hypothetical protein
MSYEPLSIDCPYCGAKAGDACMRNTGDNRVPHRDRIRLAKKNAINEDVNQIAARIRRATENK